MSSRKLNAQSAKWKVSSTQKPQIILRGCWSGLTKGGNMRSSVVFLAGLLVGCALATGFAQGQRLGGENYVNHIGFAVENFDEAFTFYTQKMGFREAFTVRDANGRPTLAYVQVSRNTFVELQQAN